MNGIPLIDQFYRLGDLFFPGACLICRHRLRRGVLCRRCRPPQPRFVAPDYQCTGCGTRLSAPEHYGICSACRLFPLPYQQLRYLWEYRGSARELVRAIKYRQSFRLGRFAAQLFSKSIARDPIAGTVDCIVPMPPSATARRRRSFSPCAVLGYMLSRELPGVDLAPQLLRHCGYRVPQATLHRSARVRNVRRAFAARNETAGRRVLLIDDVVTTGATVASAAAALLDAGAHSVCVAALCRASTFERSRSLIFAGIRCG